MSLNLGLIGRAQPLEWPKLGHINGNLILFCKILRFTNRFLLTHPSYKPIFTNSTSSQTKILLTEARFLAAQTDFTNSSY